MLAVLPGVISGTASNQPEAALLVGGQGAIAVTYFEVEPACSDPARGANELIDQRSADAIAASFGNHRQEEQLGVVGDDPHQREAERFATGGRTGQRQPD